MKEEKKKRNKVMNRDMDSELKKVGEGKRKRKVFKRERKGRNEMVKI